MIIAKALYCGELVDVLDVVGNAITGSISYMINYGGPTWVDASYLNRITWII